ncbi:MAG TPA: DNA-directed RNA polymerase subunit beta' [Anaerolineae bacterium]|nr:DNA-directed RNA polymerase subunit beta' [Anaerolineae bacterium]
MEGTDFRSLRISLASPEQIRSWSYGEVTKPETINYRRLRPEKDGLFCEAIFGPTRDYQCYCGKYKNIRYKGIICDKCGVEVTRSSVRRERLGHLELAAPVAHIWYTRRVPSHLGLLLNISRRNLDRVLYFAQYVITSVDDNARERALTRLDKEVKAEEIKIEAEIQAEATGATDDVQLRLIDLQVAFEGLDEQYEAKLAALTDEIVQDAKRLETRLDNGAGKEAEETMQLGDVVIVNAGDVIGKEHIALIQDTTTDRLSRCQVENEEDKEAARAQLKAEINALSEEKATASQEIRDRYASRFEQIRQIATTSREQMASLELGGFLNENEYREYKSRFGNVFKASMGAEAFFDILKDMDLDKLARDLWRELRTTRSKQAAKRATKRLKVVENLRKSGNRPEWMIMTVLPVIPPDLRPMVQLDGGRFATSDLNDLYRRVINRNNRLKRLLALGAPDVIIRNEKRMLQEAVDSLIDNSQRGKALSRRGRRELKSLSDMLKGKKGRFRRNLLGKRVDYSGRSVIVVGPTLKVGECGLPKVMALELFRPFVIHHLIAGGYASNVKGARRVIERQGPEVWEALENAVQDRPILLNRAPNLHRLGIQAFMPKLVEGKAIHLHPLVCSAFNADFNGDQMAVHLPLSEKAVHEAKTKMLASKNLLKPADGRPIMGPAKDMVLGVYFLTMQVDGVKGEGKIFSTLEEVEMAYDLGIVHMQAKIKVLATTYYSDEIGAVRNEDNQPVTKVIETTPGRVIFNRYLPKEIRFVNQMLNKGQVNELMTRCYRELGVEPTIQMADDIKNLGFKYATRSGVSIAVTDLTVPQKRTDILVDAQNRVDRIDRNYRRGLLTADEQYQRTVDIWNQAKDDVQDAVKEAMDPNGALAIMALSGSTKGGLGPITQLAGMRGMMADPQGRIIPVPIKSNFRDGLSAQEYFISTHGSRKGLADTALRTADAGYLTRRLVDVAQDVIVHAPDCGTSKGISVKRAENFGKQTLTDRLWGRVSAETITDPESGEIIISEGTMYTEEVAAIVDQLGAPSVEVYSPMTCEMESGICAKCYGLDLGSGHSVEMGVAVGIVAAQSIGEPGTQLTLRTFHTGGTASRGGDITQGLPRIEELFEARQKPKGEAVITEISGFANIYMSEGVRHVLITESKLLDDLYEIPAGYEVKVAEGQIADMGDIIAEKDGEFITSRNRGRIETISADSVKLVWESKDERDYEIPAGLRLSIEDGQTVGAGDQLTEGSKNPHQILEIQGRDAVTSYLLKEIQTVYRPQGQNINDKHFEVIIRKMLGKVSVTNSGDTELLPGDLIELHHFQTINEEVVEEGGDPAEAVPILLGITKASLSTDSFLSASSFQHTIKVLAAAAIAGKIDNLVGLKENVIIGKLIPAGSGFKREEPEVIEMEPLVEMDEMDFSSMLISDDTDESVLEAIAEAAKREKEGR